MLRNKLLKFDKAHLHLAKIWIWKYPSSQAPNQNNVFKDGRNAELVPSDAALVPCSVYDPKPPARTRKGLRTCSPEVKISEGCYIYTVYIYTVYICTVYIYIQYIYSIYCIYWHSIYIFIYIYTVYMYINTQYIYIYINIYIYIPSIYIHIYTQYIYICYIYVMADV